MNINIISKHINGDFFQIVFFVIPFLLGFTLMAQQKVCYGSSMRYSVDGTENSGKGSLGSTYNWSVQEPSFNGNIVINFSDRTNDVVINWGTTPPGVYTLIVSETINATGCTGLTQNLKVTVLELPPSNLSNQFVCIDYLTKEVVRPAVLDTGLSASIYSFNWQVNGNSIGITPSINVNDTGIYRVDIQNIATKCKALYEVNVGLSSSSVSKIEVDNFFEDNQNIVISVINGIGDYEFSLDGISFQDNPVFSVSKGGVYTVTIRDKNGCSNETLQAQIVTYPKFVTPNNDGYFDFWTIDGLIPEMKAKIAIFDRFGKLLKIIQHEDTGWDGTFNGISMPSDDYWFIVEYITLKGVPAVFKSHFSLIR